MKSKHSRTPLQKRSRESFDRVLGAAAELLREGGMQALTITAVSRRSRVSIGSIYCRVSGRSDLIRALQEHILSELDKEFGGMINRLRRHALPLEELVRTLIREQAMFLDRHVQILNAFIDLAGQDRVVEMVGRKYFAQAALDFKLLLLERHADFSHPKPESAAATCFTIAYGTLGRIYGLGQLDEPGGPANIERRRLVEDLSTALLAFLTYNRSTYAKS